MTETRATLMIEGMHCAACAGRVERALKEEYGVLQASVNLASETAQVVFHSGTAALLAERVSRSGYKATVQVSPEETLAAQQARQKSDISRLKRDVILAALLSLPVIFLAMGGKELLGLDQRVSWGIEWALTTLILAFPGRRFLSTGLPALWRLAPDMNSLVALGTGAAWAYSTTQLFAPSLFAGGTVGVYFETAAVIITFILLGRWIELGARAKAGAAIRALMDLQPDTTTVNRDGMWLEVETSSVLPGERLRVEPGARVPVDGTVSLGTPFINESMITGEPLPAGKGPADTVTGGTLNGDNAFEMTATSVGADTTLAQILRMVEQAQGAKLPVQALADRVIRWFVPIVLGLASTAVLVWLIAGYGLDFALSIGIAVLIVSCPCAVGLATPISVRIGLSRAARDGLHFREGAALQRLAEARVFAFDKTGTLTKGAPRLAELVAAPGFDGPSLLPMLAAVEQQAGHPLGAALVDASQEAGLALPKAQDVQAAPGRGVFGRVGQATVSIGNADMMKDAGASIDEFAQLASERAAQGQPVFYAAIGGQIAALIAVADDAKPDAKDSIAQLSQTGAHVHMLTGDSPETAKAIGAKLGFAADMVHAGLLPADKRGILETLGASGDTTVFIGDGINDAPALAQADVGIAMGAGSDSAIQTAALVLKGGQLSQVLRARKISAATMRNIRQNLFWAFAYNVALIPVAAGLLFPIFDLLLSPMLAAAAMAFSSVFVVTNALRLNRA